MAISKGSWSPASGMKENWLVQIFETGSTTNFIGASFFDQTCDSESYVGGIINIPSIREKINVFKSSSSLSNVSIDLSLGCTYVRSNGNADVADISKELIWQGGRYYLNGTVKIFSSLSNDSDFTNVPQLYEGRLESMTHTDSKLSLNVVAQRPWENLKFPNVYSAEKVVAPIAYGDFVGNDSLYTGTGTDNWRPVPFTKADAASAYFTVGTVADTGLSKVSQYVPSRDGFVPFESASTSTTTFGSVENVAVGVDGKYQYYTTPSSDAENSSTTGVVESNMSNAYDLNTGTYGQVRHDETVPNGGRNRTHIQRFTVAGVEAGTKIVLTYRIADYTKGGKVESYEITPYLETASNGATGTAHSADTASDQTLTLIAIGAETYIDVKVNFEAEEEEDFDGSPDSADSTFRIYELSVSNAKSENQLEVVYTDADGSFKNYRGLTTTLVANIHEAHRQFFHTYLGIDTDGAGSTDPDGWSDLDTDRAGWTIRAWINEPMTAKQILDKLAFEGCFVYTWSASAGLKYIHVKNAYSSSNFSIDKNDVRNVNCNHTHISELIADITVNYDKHPAKDEYRSQATASESSIKGNYNLSTEEGNLTFDLDWLVASIGSDLTPGGGTENDSFIGYLGQLRGKPRSIVKADVINPAYFGMEVGDIVDFSGNMLPTGPFGKSFGSAYRYMVTSLKRSSGNITAEFTEVF